MPCAMWLFWTRHQLVSPGGERGEILRAKRIDAQGGGPAGDQSFWDRGVASNHKVPEEIAPRVGSSRRFPGEFLK